jgi:hypothetical protein
MQKLFTLIPLILITVNSAQAQIGWTLEKCRELFVLKHDIIQDKDSDTIWWLLTAVPSRRSLGAAPVSHCS